MAGDDLKSMSATHIGKMSWPANFCHFWESVFWRWGGVVKSKDMVNLAVNGQRFGESTDSF